MAPTRARSSRLRSVDSEAYSRGHDTLPPSLAAGLPDARSAVNFIQITPGAGGMYCGNCLRDNALVAELRRQGHAALMLPMYLPLNLDEQDASVGSPIFFGGINVYLDQKLPLFRHAPGWLRRRLASPALLRWATGRAAKTRPEEVGDLTISMLRGEEGNQTRALDELIDWLRQQPRPDWVCLSNALLIGLTRRLKRDLGTRVVCQLSGEDSFLDGLPAAARDLAWRTLAERARDVNLFLAPSRYFADLMTRRLNLSPDRVRVVPTGLNLDGFHLAPSPTSALQPPTSVLRPPTSALRLPTSDTLPPAPVLGYFARMCAEKGLGTLVDAYLHLRQRDRVKNLRLHVGGGLGPSDEPFVNGLRARLQAAGLAGDVEFHPNLERAAKLAFLRLLTVFSVPAAYGEAFGLYLIEALAAGVPIVQPRHAAFPEVVEATGGGVLCEPGDAVALATAIEELLLDPARARALGEAGRQAVIQEYSIGRMAERVLALLAEPF
jgi:glycosyltransferase involved in cell wall biosynthesis